MYYAPPFAGSTQTQAHGHHHIKSYASAYTGGGSPAAAAAAAPKSSASVAPSVWTSAAAPRTPDRYERTEAAASAQQYHHHRDADTPRAAYSSHAAAAAVNTASFMTQVHRGASTAANSPVKAAAPPRINTAQATQGYSQRSARVATPTSPTRTLLPSHALSHRQLLVLDMDETLLHASVQPTADHHVRFRVDMSATQSVDVYVKFRPYVSEFLATCARHFEVAVFTASISAYANQVLDHLDPHGRYVHHRLFREHCTEMDGTYVKDLSLLGRPLHRISIVDNSPVAYSLHPQNAIPITSWFDDDSDRELLDLLTSLEQLARLNSVYDHLDINHPKSPSTPSKALWR